MCIIHEKLFIPRSLNTQSKQNENNLAAVLSLSLWSSSSSSSLSALSLSSPFVVKGSRPQLATDYFSRSPPSFILALSQLLRSNNTLFTLAVGGDALPFQSSRTVSRAFVIAVHTTIVRVFVRFAQSRIKISYLDPYKYIGIVICLIRL